MTWLEVFGVLWLLQLLFLFGLVLIIKIAELYEFITKHRSPNMSEPKTAGEIHMQWANENISQQKKSPNMSKCDEMATTVSQTCYCAGPTCSGCEENTKKLFSMGWDACAADAEAQEAQLVELVRELSAVIDRAMYLERLGNGSTAAWAAEALENARAKLTELNISTEGEK